MKLYDKISLLTDRFMASDGLKEGDVGYIIEIYSDGNMEIEFSNPETGITYAQIVVEPKDVVLEANFKGES